jgi:hypothetical protein
MRLWKGPTMSKPHSIRYIKQLMDWGFDKEFIARDAGINVESLMTRLRRAEERERNGNQRTESGTSSGQSDS